MTDTTAMSDSEFWEFLRSLRPQYPSSVDADVMTTLSAATRIGTADAPAPRIFAASQQAVASSLRKRELGRLLVSERDAHPAEVGNAAAPQAYHARFQCPDGQPRPRPGPG